MSDDLTLEKMRIVEKLADIEKHIQEGQFVRGQIVNSMDSLTKSVIKLEATVFGDTDKVGIVHEVKHLVKSAEEIKSTLKRIFWIVATALLVAALPKVTEFFHLITK